MLALLWLFQIVLLNDFYKYIKINQLKTYANYVSTNIDNITFDSKFNDTLADKDICMLIFSENGQLKYSSDILKNCVIHRMPHSMGFELAKKMESENTNFLEQNYDNIRNYIDPINLSNFKPGNILNVTKVTDSNNNTFYIMLNSNMFPVASTVSTLRLQLIIITIIMLILSFILSIRVSKVVSDPIIDLNKNAKQLATGDYSTKFNNDGYSEIVELSNTLNYTTEELSKVENLRRELISNISHDLRTPLTMITGYGEVMRDLPGENTPENIQIIIDEAKRLTSLVNNVLDISKYQSGTQVLTPEKFNLTELLGEIKLRYDKLTEKDGYNIIFEKDEDVFVSADKIRITQVIYNLLNNAITYTGEDKKIIIRQTVADDKVKVEIIDSGEGIAKENIPYIWDRYFKVKETHKRAQIGTGLGLSIVKEILKLHNAEYGVESELNKGSDFWFTLKKITHKMIPPE